MESDSSDCNDARATLGRFEATTMMHCLCVHNVPQATFRGPLKAFIVLAPRSNARITTAANAAIEHADVSGAAFVKRLPPSWFLLAWRSGISNPSAKEATYP